VHAAVTWSSRRGKYRLQFGELLACGTWEASSDCGYSSVEALLDGTDIQVIKGSQVGHSGAWSDKERNAVHMRKNAGEQYKSIASSFGRTLQSVKSMGAMMSNSEYAPRSGKVGKRTGHRVGWRNVVALALKELPLERGSAKQVREVLEDADKFPQLEDKLDTELQSGHRGVLKWHQQVNLALSKNPEFEFHGKDKEGRTVWKLDLTLKPPDKSSKKEKRRRAMQRRQDRESVDMTQC